MEEPRNEITGDHLITPISQYYPAGLKIFAPKTEYISGGSVSNGNLAFFNKVSYKSTVLTGFFFLSNQATQRVNNRCSQMFLRHSTKSVPRSREGTAVLVKLRKHV